VDDSQHGTNLEQAADKVLHARAPAAFVQVLQRIDDELRVDQRSGSFKQSYNFWTALALLGSPDRFHHEQANPAAQIKRVNDMDPSFRKFACGNKRVLIR